MTGCISCELIQQDRLKRLKDYYIHLCNTMLGMKKPPRESFNRWIMDMYCSKTQKTTPPFTSTVCTMLIPHCFDAMMSSNAQQHRRDFCDRLASRQFGTGMFWELIDELPYSVHISPASSGGRYNKRKRKTKKGTTEIYQEPLHNQVSSRCDVLFPDMETFKNTRKDLDVYDYAAYSTASSIRQIGLHKATPVYDVDDSRIFDYFYEKVFENKGQSLSKTNEDKAYALKWADQLLQECRSDDDATFAQDVTKRNWFKLLQSSSHIPQYNLHKESRRSSSSQHLSRASSIPLSVSIVFGLRNLRRPVTMDNYCVRVITLCCRLEAFLLYLFFACTPALLKMSSDFFVCTSYGTRLSPPSCTPCIPQDGLCGLQWLWRCRLTGNVKKKNLSPLALTKLCDTELHDSKMIYIKLIWCSSDSDRFLCLRLGFAVLHELWIRFQRAAAFSQENFTPEEYSKLFLYQLIRLLLRYSIVSAFGKEGRGLQASTSEGLWTVILNHLSVTHECFASPFNATLPNYFSMFPDADRYFGSKGSFFTLQEPLRYGSYQVNPPFVETILERTVECIKEWLIASEKNASPNDVECDLHNGLSFVLIVPNWDNGGGCTFLDLLYSASEFITTQLVLEPHQHRYASCYQDAFVETCNVEALKQLLYPDVVVKNSFSSISSSLIFILQNRMGKKRWPVTPNVISDILRECNSHNSSKSFIKLKFS